MTLPVSTRRNSYVGTSLLNEYDFTFKIFNQADIKVVVENLAGTLTTLVLNTDYTVDGVGEASGGSITLVSAGQAWLTTGYLTTGYKLAILGNKSYLQELSIRNQGAYYPSVVEDQLDKFGVMLQQLYEKSRRALGFVETSTATDITIPPLEALSVPMVNAGADGFQWITRDSLVGDQGPQGDAGADGTNGTNGTDGTDGADGVGVPAGGTTGQVLSKIDGTDFNTQWSSPGATLADGDYGDVVVSSSGSVILFDSSVVTAAAKTVLDDTTVGAMRTTLGVGTGDSPEFASINVGAATDTTITRVSAGVIAVEGSNVLLASGLGSVTQAYDAELAAIAGLTSAADKGIQFTGSGTAATYDLTTAGKALLDDANAAAQRTTLGSTTVGDAVFVAANAAAARSAIGTVIGTDVQAYDAQLSSLIRQNSQSTAYTTVLTDGGKHILHPSTDNNARTFTIAANGSVAYPIGTAITFINEINTVTIAIASDTLKLAGAGTTGSRTLAANGMATAIKTDTTTWWISGTGLT